jgi:hypothetical protein
MKSDLLSPIDRYFYEKEEPIKSCLQFLRIHILKQDKNLTETWKYGMPFYCYKDKMFCYLWVHKKLLVPYLGIVEGRRVEHPDLIIEKRARMKILLLDPNKDMPIRKINTILKLALALYK